ncbi:MAG: hypothetical protein HRT36_05015 [Alphaproteobacteria bacterium]|nr:hypothetical protein [Alphaproteobacteria bacterium]
MSDSADKENQELAEVTRVVDEIARQIHLEQSLEQTEKPQQEEVAPPEKSTENAQQEEGGELEQAFAEAVLEAISESEDEAGLTDLFAMSMPEGKSSNAAVSDETASVEDLAVVAEEELDEGDFQGLLNGFASSDKSAKDTVEEDISSPQEQPHGTDQAPKNSKIASLLRQLFIPAALRIPSVAKPETVEDTALVDALEVAADAPVFADLTADDAVLLNESPDEVLNEMLLKSLDPEPESPTVTDLEDAAFAPDGLFGVKNAISLNIEETESLTEENLSYDRLNFDVRDLLGLALTQQHPLVRFAEFAEDLPLNFPIDRFRAAVNGSEDDFVNALADTRSSAANINILLRYAEALLAEQRGDYTSGVAILEELGCPALDNFSMRYDFARIAELSGDLEKAQQEYHTLIGATDNREMQQLALARLIDLAHQSGDDQAVLPLLRQLCSRTEQSARARLTHRFYGLINRVDDADDRQWLLDNLLAIDNFTDDAFLLEESYKLAMARGDVLAQAAQLERLAAVSGGVARVGWLQRLVKLREKQSDFEAVETALRALWRAAEDQDDDTLVRTTLHRLLGLAPQDETVLVALAACHRADQDDASLISLLSDLQAVVKDSLARKEILNEVIALHEASGDSAAADDALMILLQHTDDPLPRILQQTESTEGDRQKRWYTILSARARDLGKISIQIRGLQGLLNHAQSEGDTVAEVDTLQRLRVLEPQDKDVLQSLAAFHRAENNSAALVSVLSDLQSVAAEPWEREEILNEMITLHEADDDVAAADDVLMMLLEQIDNPLQRILQQAEATEGTWRKHWFTILRERAQKSGDPAAEMSSLHGLLACVQSEGDSTTAIALLRDISSLSDAPRNIWWQLAALYRDAQDRVALAKVLDQLLRQPETPEEHEVLLRERIDLHLDAQEVAVAQEKLATLLSITSERTEVLLQLLEIAGDDLDLDSRILHNRELTETLPEGAPERFDALHRLGKALVQRDEPLEALEVLMQGRGLCNIEAPEYTELSTLIEEQTHKLDLGVAIQAKPELMETLRQEFSYLNKLRGQFFRHTFNQALAGKDVTGLQKLLASAMEDQEVWQYCLNLEDKQLIAAMVLLKNSAASRPFIECFARDGNTRKVRFYATQLLAPMFEAAQEWEKAIDHWRQVLNFMAQRGDLVTKVIVQLRLFKLYRALQKKAEVEALIAELAQHPATIDERLGKHMIHPLELYGVRCVHDGDAQGGLAVMSRALKLRNIHNKLDVSASNLFGNLAEVYIQLNDPDRAQAHFDQAIALLKKHPEQSPQIQQKIAAFRARLLMFEYRRELSRLQGGD